MSWDLIFVGAALILAIVVQFQAKGASILAWAVILLAIAGLPGLP